MSDLANLRTMKFFMFIENLLSVYRNYKFYDEKKRKFVLLHVIIQLCLCVVLAANDLYIIHEYFYNNLSVFCLVTILFLEFEYYTLVCIIYGISQSHSFEELINTLEKMHKIFKNDVAYTKSIKKMNLKCIMAVAYFLIVASVMFYERINFKFLDRLLYFDTLQFFNKVVINYRYLVEYFVYSLYLSIIHEIFKRFNGLLDEAYKKLDRKIDEEITDEIHLEMIEEWAGMYRDLVTCGKAFGKCFGAQIIIGIALSSLHYILITYRFWVTLLNDFDKSGKKVTILMNLSFEITYHTTVVVIAMVSAQRVYNEVWSLRRTLARLYNALTAYPNRPELRKIRNFIRMAVKNPVEINSMPNFVMGLAVLPMSLSVSVSYIIVMLQLDKTI